jgi:predicted DNA-binding transcriptional regulator AlpA
MVVRLGSGASRGADRALSTRPPEHHHLDRKAFDLAVAGAAAGPPDELINTTTLAEWLGVSTQWVEIGRSKDWGPPHLKLGPSRIRYLRSSVIAWLREREHESTLARRG